MARIGTKTELDFCTQVTKNIGINITQVRSRLYTDTTRNCVTVNGINKIEDIPKVKPMEMIKVL